jgi:hypothetical protein
MPFCTKCGAANEPTGSICTAAGPTPHGGFHTVLPLGRPRRPQDVATT